jgi:hypothetical protein
MRPALPIALLAATLAAACGYRPVLGTLPDGLEAIHVPTVTNETAFAGLTAPLTSSLRKRVARSGLPVVGPGKGGARLEARIVDVRSEPGMVTAANGRLVPVDTLWTIRVEARLVGPGDRSLSMTEVFERQGRAYSGGSVRAEEALGGRSRLALLDELADVIVRSLLEP